MTPAPANDVIHPTINSRGCIQIWSLTPRSQEERDLAKAQMPEDVLQDYMEGYDADMVCEMVVCVEGAEVREIKWLPFSCCDDVSRTLFLRCSADEIRSRKMGKVSPRLGSFQHCYAQENSHFSRYLIPRLFGQRNRRKPKTTCLLRLSVRTRNLG
jgi:hypothetical protein